MMVKNTEKGKCFLALKLFPFFELLLKAWGAAEIPKEKAEQMISCDPGCVFYRKGVRYVGPVGAEEAVPFEECAINIIADNAEIIHQRQFATQQEMGEVKNATLLQSLIALAGNPEDKMKLNRMIAKAGGPLAVIDKIKEAQEKNKLTEGE